MLIDTHEAIERLQRAGASKELAEAVTKVVTDADDKVATKDDLQRELAKTKRQIIVWTVGLNTGAVGLLLTLFQFAA